MVFLNCGQKSKNREYHGALFMDKNPDLFDFSGQLLITCYASSALSVKITFVDEKKVIVDEKKQLSMKKNNCR